MEGKGGVTTSDLLHLYHLPDALFGQALLAIGKKKTTDQKGGKTEAKGRDADDDANKKTTSRAMKVRADQLNFDSKWKRTQGPSQRVS